MAGPQVPQGDFFLSVGGAPNNAGMGGLGEPPSSFGSTPEQGGIGGGKGFVGMTVYSGGVQAGFISGIHGEGNVTVQHTSIGTIISVGENTVVTINVGGARVTARELSRVTILDDVSPQLQDQHTGERAPQRPQFRIIPTAIPSVRGSVDPEEHESNGGSFLGALSASSGGARDVGFWAGNLTDVSTAVGAGVGISAAGLAGIGALGPGAAITAAQLASSPKTFEMARAYFEQHGVNPNDGSITAADNPGATGPGGVGGPGSASGASGGTGSGPGTSSPGQGPI